MKPFAVVMVVILLLILGCLQLVEAIQKGSQGNLPIRLLSIRIDVDQRQKLFDQLQQFADENGFSILVREVRVIPEDVFIDMKRDEIEISAVSDIDDPTLLEFTFYELNHSHPPSQDVVDKLFNSLKDFVNEVPSVIIVEQ